MSTAVQRLLPVLAIAAVLAAFPAMGGKFAVDLVTKIMILSIFALSLELLVGQTGLVCFGHAAFLGLAAYTAALLTPQSNPVSLLWLLPASVVAAGLYALVVGALSLRTRGIYFIMVTLAFAQMAYYVFHDTKLGGGSDGIYLYFRPELTIAGWQPFDLDKGHTFYFFVLACLAFTYWALGMLVGSRFGHALAGIRVNEQRMRAVGFSTYGYKLAAFVLSGMFAGLAGFLYALKDGFVNPELLSWHQSGAVLIMIILGGLGHLRGAVIGAFAFALLQELFQSEAIFGGLAQHWQLTLGFAIIACVALMPNGIVGIGRQLARRVSHLRRWRHA